MRKLLIADGSDDLCAVLGRVFRRYFEVHTCCDGDTALVLLRHLQPDALLLDLSLPKLDGLSLLRTYDAELPIAIIGMADAPSHYEQQAAVDLGIGCILRKPFRSSAALSHLESLLQFRETTGHYQSDSVYIAESHMNILGMNPKHDGYQQLRLGIPLFRQDPSMRLEKELYPAIALSRPEDKPKQMERSMRTAIQFGWKHGNREIWLRYFPGYEECPAVKVFIARLAQFSEPAEQIRP